MQPLPEVVYVDDPKLFGVLAQAFPGAKLVQDGFHLLDRFSRAIPATNTLKGKWKAVSARTKNESQLRLQFSVQQQHHQRLCFLLSRCPSLLCDK